MKLNPGLDRRLKTLPIPRILLCSRMKSLSAPPVTGSSSSPIGTSGHCSDTAESLACCMPIPEADIEEIRVPGATLPHPRTTDDGVQFLRIAMHEQLAAALVLGGALHFVAVLVELAQIDTPLLFLLAPRDPPPTSEASAEHQRAEPDQSHHREKSRLQRPHPRGVHHDKVPMIPTSSAGSAIISRMLRGSRSGSASGGATATRTGGTVGAAYVTPRTKPRLDMPNLLPVWLPGSAPPRRRQ